MNYDKYEAFKVEHQDGVAILRVDYPKTENCLDGVLHRELESIWTDVAQDPEAKAIVLTGTGPHFIGPPVPQFLERIAVRGLEPSRMFAGLEHIRNLIANQLDVEQPIIAAVNGDAVGLCATVALACDMVLAAEHVHFSENHLRWEGIVPGDGATIIWPQLVGLSRAKELLLLGDKVTAREAERIGLINRVVGADRLLSEALEIGKRLAHGAGWSVRATKRLLNRRLREDVMRSFELAISLELHSQRAANFQEGVRAMVEQREPRFTDI